MQLELLNVEWVKSSAPTLIFERGEVYARAGLVQGLRSFPEEQSISAEVLGNFGIYEVKLDCRGEQLQGECNCPYDKTPCKHIVAVALDFIRQRQRYLHEAQRWQKTRQRLRSRLGNEAPQVLVELILHAARQSPLFEQEVHLRYADKDPQTQILLRQRIRKVLEDSEMDYVAFRQAESVYRKYLVRAETLSSETLRVGIYTAILETIVRIFNAYALEDQGLEGLCLEIWDKLVPSLQQPQFQAECQQLRLFLKRELRRENCILIQIFADMVKDIEALALLHA